MIKQIAWNTFKNTGNINTFLEIKQIAKIEENIRIGKDEVIKSKRNNTRRETGIRF